MAALIRRVTAWALQLKLVRAFLHYSEHRGAQLADSITYRALFSIFAGVLLGFSLAALWLSGNPEAWRALVSAVDAAVPGLVGDGGVIDVTVIQAPAGLTIAGVLSLIGLVGAAIGAIGSARSALRILGDRAHDDVFWGWVLLRNLGLAIAIAIGLVASAVVTFLGTAFLGVVEDWLGPGAGALSAWATRILSIVVVLILDTAIVAVLFVVLSGVRAPRRAVLTGSILGGIGLTVLQQLSGLFVGGASSNPLLASFASLVALLLWVNLSAQVILIASSYIVVGAEEASDRVRARHGASTFAQRRVRRAEDAVRLAGEELRLARAEEEKERTALREAARG
ncbi:YihY/virulence factor BrkB family protein [Microbacterium sp.]|uniref:YihY/virulence factor BrkB family protein n=1 Tax=Microbacterium sp. TaxID=51671 RepID=UPI00092736D2|nr:YihY/virulence factor BrkB family protein [Microbacterium sp.]MBN9191035.1 YihY/virulence factor BrkB family protein [Microbacterium sp.]OJU69695.1 MAG: ribonuclease BN [Microbacterium sp. 70-38]